MAPLAKRRGASCCARCRTACWVPSNQRLLADLLQHPQFVAADFSTGFIAEHFSDIARPAISEEALALAAALFYRHSAAVHRPALAGWRNNANVPWTYRLGIDEHRHEVSVRLLADDHVQVANIDIHIRHSDGRWASLDINGVRRRVAYHLQGTQLWLLHAGNSLCVSNQTQTVASREAPASNGTVKAPMDGAIILAQVREGDRVSKGQLLLVLEAMKMEHPLKAGIDGVVKAIHVTAGDQVRNGQVLLQIE